MEQVIYVEDLGKKNYNDLRHMGRYMICGKILLNNKIHYKLLNKEGLYRADSFKKETVA